MQVVDDDGKSVQSKVAVIGFVARILRRLGKKTKRKTNKSVFSLLP